MEIHVLVIIALMAVALVFALFYLDKAIPAAPTQQKTGENDPHADLEEATSIAKTKPSPRQNLELIRQYLQSN